MGRDETGALQVMLVVGDDAVRRSLQLLLHWNGYHVRAFADAISACVADDLDRVRWLIAAYRLADGDGLTVLDRLRRQGWQGRSLLVTGQREPGLASRAIAAGFDAVIEKPLWQNEVLSALR
jgi:FixJ family two-component response regulator